MKRIAINGFGRIGRAYLRSSLSEGDIEVVAINDLIEIETAAYLFKYDTAHGKFEGDIVCGEDFIELDGKKILWINEKDPSKLPWRSLEIDVVIESTGVFNDYEKSMAHVMAGAKKVIISAPVKGDVPKDIRAATVLVGVNTDKAKVCDIVSNASCTTNAAGIPMKALDDSIGIAKAVLNTVHGYTATQQLVDSNSRKKDLRFGRAGAVNIIPSSTGAAIATTKALEGLEGNFDGLALRVPVLVGSIADITFIAKRNTTVEEVNSVLKASEGELFKTTTEPIVSSDVIGEKYVSIADLSLTRVVGGNLVKVMFWYDNEMGYTSSLISQTRNI